MTALRKASLADGHVRVQGGRPFSRRAIFLQPMCSRDPPIANRDQRSLHPILAPVKLPWRQVPETGSILSRLANRDKRVYL
jgi:hypothetical protein